MKGRHRHYFVAACIAVPAMASTAAAQDAIVRQNAAGICQGTLPQFAGSLRARPLGLANEGSTSAFVTCALAGADGARYRFAEAIFKSRGTANATVTCTFVTGRVIGSAPVYYTITAVVTPGNVTSAGRSFPSEDPVNMVSFNCNLPPDTEIAYVRLDREV